MKSVVEADHRTPKHGPTPGQIRYLLAIRWLLASHGQARCSSLARHLGIRKPSVTRMVDGMEASGLVARDACGALILTRHGREKAERYAYCATILADRLRTVLAGLDAIPDMVTIIMATLTEDDLRRLAASRRRERRGRHDNHDAED